MALTPVAVLELVDATAIARLCVLAANESCSVPALPATSIVDRRWRRCRTPAKSTSPSWALPVTCTMMVTEPLSGILAALIWTMSIAVLATPLVV